MRWTRLCLRDTTRQLAVSPGVVITWPVILSISKNAGKHQIIGYLICVKYTPIKHICLMISSKLYYQVFYLYSLPYRIRFEHIVCFV